MKRVLSYRKSICHFSLQHFLTLSLIRSKHIFSSALSANSTVVRQRWPYQLFDYNSIFKKTACLNSTIFLFQSIHACRVDNYLQIATTRHRSRRTYINGINYGINNFSILFFHTSNMNGESVNINHNDTAQSSFIIPLQ